MIVDFGIDEVYEVLTTIPSICLISMIFYFFPPLKTWFRFVSYSKDL